MFCNKKLSFHLDCVSSKVSLEVLDPQVSRSNTISLKLDAQPGWNSYMTQRVLGRLLKSHKCPTFNMVCRILVVQEELQQQRAEEAAARQSLSNAERSRDVAREDVARLRGDLEERQQAATELQLRVESLESELEAALSARSADATLITALRERVAVLEPQADLVPDLETRLRDSTTVLAVVEGERDTARIGGEGATRERDVA